MENILSAISFFFFFCFFTFPAEFKTMKSWLDTKYKKAPNKLNLA